MGEFAELRLKFAVLIATVDVLPTIIQHNMVVTKISETQSQDLV